MSALLSAALGYAERGWHVFPCYEVTPEGWCSCSAGARCRTPGKHPRTGNGFEDATTDPTTISNWWTLWPSANVAISTGPSGLLVIDIDVKRTDGKSSFAELEESRGRIGETVEVLTPSGGLHLYLKRNGLHIGCSQNVLAQGVDVRAEGGYVLAPPSNHASGRLYQIELAHHPDDVPILPVPEWMVAILAPKAESATAVRPSNRIERPEPGERHPTLWNYAVRWARAGLSEAEIRTMVFRLGDDWGIGERLNGGELENIVIGAMRRAPKSEGMPEPADLSRIEPRAPEFDIEGVFRRGALNVIWAAPGSYKTTLLLRMCHEMMGGPPSTRFLEHPDFYVRRPWKRVLWVASEESGPDLSHWAGAVRRGLGDQYRLDGEIWYLFASDRKRRVVLDDLGDLLARHGPFDVAVLDSLTGLRPKSLDGQRIRWDLDNDAINEQMLMLRGLSAETGTSPLVVHHSSRDTEKFRGGVDLWASADTMAGLILDGGRIKWKPEKVRGGKVPMPFYINPTWSRDPKSGLLYLDLSYASVAPSLKLSPTAKSILGFVTGRSSASQADMIAANLAHRSTIQSALRQLVASGALQDSGLKANGSSIYVVPGGVGASPPTPNE